MSCSTILSQGSADKRRMATKGYQSSFLDMVVRRVGGGTVQALRIPSPLSSFSPLLRSLSTNHAQPIPYKSARLCKTLCTSFDCTFYAGATFFLIHCVHTCRAAQGLALTSDMTINFSIKCNCMYVLKHV